MQLPQQGRPPAEVLDQLGTFKHNDLPWAEGRVFAYIYDADPVAMQLVKDAYAAFLVENGLDPTSFPSCLELGRQVVGMAVSTRLPSSARFASATPFCSTSTRASAACTCRSPRNSASIFPTSTCPYRA